MRRAALLVIAVMLVTSSARAQLDASGLAFGPVPPRVYANVALSYTAGFFTSKGFAQYSNSWGDNAPALLTGKHYISGTDGGTPALASISDATGYWAGTINGPGPTPGTLKFYTCYRGTVAVSTSDASQTVSSSAICFDADYTAPQVPYPIAGCTPSETNPCTGGGGGSGDTTDYRTDTCYYQIYDCMSPIVLNLQNGAYQLSGRTAPVHFDIDADGVPDTMTWTAPSAAMGFLALDRNGNGIIDNGAELFGDHTPLGDGSRAKNGFEALKQYDSNGDGVIDARDPIWQKLLIWIDANHDGKSTPDELRPITATEITRIDLDYHWTGRRDGNGNVFRFEGKAHFGTSSKPFYDIFFLVKKQ